MVAEGNEEGLCDGEEVPSGEKDRVALELGVADKSIEEVCEGLFELERVTAKEPVEEALEDKEAIELVADEEAWGEPLPSAVGKLESDAEGDGEVFGDAVSQEEGERTPEPVAEGSAVALPKPDSLCECEDEEHIVLESETRPEDEGEGGGEKVPERLPVGEDEAHTVKVLDVVGMLLGPPDALPGGDMVRKGEGQALGLTSREERALFELIPEGLLLMVAK